MPSKVKREGGCFTADFSDGKVTVVGETFLSGFFFVNAMNEYWQPYNGDDGADFEIAQKLLVMKSGAKIVRDEISVGYLYPPHAEKLYDEILYKINAIANAKPFYSFRSGYQTGAVQTVFQRGKRCRNMRLFEKAGDVQL